MDKDGIHWIHTESACANTQSAVGGDRCKWIWESGYRACAHSNLIGILLIFDNGGKCETTYLFPAMEISGDAIGNDNSFCEQNETCVYNPHMGVYQGHGTLVNSGCNADAILSGITLMTYDTNGF